MTKDALEISQSTISDTMISAAEEVFICTEVREIMQKKFVAGRVSLGTNLGTQNEDFVNSGSTIPSTSVIDLVAESTQSHGKPSPFVIPRSLVSVASTLPMLGMVGAPQDFRI